MKSSIWQPLLPKPLRAAASEQGSSISCCARIAARCTFAAIVHAGAGCRILASCQVHRQRRQDKVACIAKGNGSAVRKTTALNAAPISCEDLTIVQSDRSLARSERGLGIGLSVVKRLIEMHQGIVSASSAGPGKGSTLEIRLPLVASPDEDVPAAAGAAKPAVCRRVLIVDDNRDAADAISMLMEVHGHDVRTAYGGEEALKVAADFDADMVLWTSVCLT